MSFVYGLCSFFPPRAYLESKVITIQRNYCNINEDSKCMCNLDNNEYSYFNISSTIGLYLDRDLSMADCKLITMLELNEVQRL